MGLTEKGSAFPKTSLSHVGFFELPELISSYLFFWPNVLFEILQLAHKQKISIETNATITSENIMCDCDMVLANKSKIKNETQPKSDLSHDMHNLQNGVLIIHVHIYKQICQCIRRTGIPNKK